MLVVMRHEGGWCVTLDGKPVEEDDNGRPVLRTKELAVEDALRRAKETGDRIDIVPSIYD